MTNVKKAIQEGSQVEAGCDRENLEKGYLLRQHANAGCSKIRITQGEKRSNLAMVESLNVLAKIQIDYFLCVHLDTLNVYLSLPS